MSAAPEAVPKTNDNLSQGLVLQLVPVLDQVGVRLVELETSQKELLKTFRQFDELKDNVELDSVLEVLNKLPQYANKVKDLRHEMVVLQERSSRLAKRAIKLQRKRQEDEIQEELERRKFAEQDQKLAAKVVSSSS